jgi:predicted NAD/FAD-dependent oxidoreductase
LADTETRLHPGMLVRQLERSATGSWRLLNGQGTCFAESDWLVITGNLLAHQRSVGLLGWSEPPLAALAEQENDPQLRETVRLLANIHFEARCNLLAVLQGEAAAPWRALPFRQLGFTASAQERWGLRRLSIQPQADGRCGVVVHSSADFAATRLSLVGRGSLAEELQGALPEERRAQRRKQEHALLAELASALEEAVAPWLQPGCLTAAIGSDAEGAALMRWGAAFPLEPGLPEEFTISPDRRIGFCGDLVQGVGFGRVEGSLRSAETLAERLLGEI